MNNSKAKKRNLSQEDLFNFSELFKLMKPRVMSLVIFTCAVGLLTSPNLVSTKDAIIGILFFSIYFLIILLTKFLPKKTIGKYQFGYMRFFSINIIACALPPLILYNFSFKFVNFPAHNHLINQMILISIILFFSIF